MEYLIDIYARSPDSLSEADRARIDALLAENAGFRDYLDYLTEFYRSFRDLCAEDIPDHVRAFADSLVRLPRRVPLRPPAARSRTEPSGSGYRFLHADSVSAPESIRTVGSLICTDYGVLVRMIEDRETGELRGYVLSPDQGDAGRSLVLFENLDAVCIADESGVFRIPLTDVDSPEQLLDGYVELVLPIGESVVGASGLPGETVHRLLESERVHVDARRIREVVQLRIYGDRDDGFLVVDAKGMRSLHRLSEESIEFTTDVTTDEFTVRLYAG